MRGIHKVFQRTKILSFGDVVCFEGEVYFFHGLEMGKVLLCKSTDFSEGYHVHGESCTTIKASKDHVYYEDELFKKL